MILWYRSKQRPWYLNLFGWKAARWAINVCLVVPLPFTSLCLFSYRDLGWTMRTGRSCTRTQAFRMVLKWYEPWLYKAGPRETGRKTLESPTMDAPSFCVLVWLEHRAPSYTFIKYTHSSTQAKAMNRTTALLVEALWAAFRFTQAVEEALLTLSKTFVALLPRGRGATV